ncbi:hypothetical protein [Aureimonas ureilytica]|uniref:hypothetical protein n=1 Tax=Aureimonas ureilytica TaxID=401562 RepID=UPI000377534E|nr:hypothetical protein [Aureimonas ureilytica]
MMDLRKSTGDMRLALKAAVRRAVALAGGGRSVENATRVSHSVLSRYGLPEHTDQHCPLDVAIDLDLEAGQPVILAALAEMQGYDIVRREPVAPSDTPWCAKISAMVQQDGRVTSTLLEAIADGQISPAEARCIIPELEREIELLRRVRERVIAESGVRS